MDTHKIANLLVNIQVKGKILEAQSKAYRIESKENVDITIMITSDFLKKKQKETPSLTMDECEYIWTSIMFYHKLLEFQGFMFHSSAVSLDNEAYLFSAKSGVGKSTHTRLWQRYFGKERARIINDDKPALRCMYDKIYVCGTPWSGKTNKNLPINIPLKAIVFIERSEQNWITHVNNKEAIKLILDQTLRPKELDKMENLLGLMETILKTINIYKMGCNMSEDAVKLAYKTITN